MRIRSGRSAIFTRAPDGNPTSAVALTTTAATKDGADAFARRRCAAQRRIAKVRLADEARNEGRLRSLVEIARRADLLQLAAIENGDAIGHRQRFGLVMRDEHRP